MRPASPALCLLRCGFLALLAGTGSTLILPAATTNLVQRPQSIRPVTATNEAGPPDPRRPAITRRTLKAAEKGAKMKFEVALKMRNFQELQDRINHGQLISPQEMAAKYDPLPSDYQATAIWLKGLGFKITRQDSNRLAIFASGTVDQVAQGFQVTFARVALQGTEYTSAITAPNVPAGLSPALVGINGLQPHLRAHLHSHAIVASIPAATADASTTSGPYQPSQILGAYNAGTTLTGAGQTIAIVMTTFPAMSDLQLFWQTFGINQSSSNITFIQSVSGTLPTDTDDLDEASLDAEWSSSIAPSAKVRFYATVTLGDDDVDKAYQQIYTDATTHPEDNIHEMSMSYGGGEESDTLAGLFTQVQYFANLASAGVTVFASSGDGGSSPGNQAGQNNGSTEVEYPACYPYVTAVGGTSLKLNSPANTINRETGWYLSGGGFSQEFNRPAWQTGTGFPSGTTRCVPDVASAASPNTPAIIYLNGSQVYLGGTSWSSPTWAGFCALINQARTTAGIPVLGLLGPKIYPLLGTANFHDITNGNNGYAAGTGYDLVTGLGSPNVQNLVQSLSVQTLPSVAAVTVGNSATFTAAASGTASAYQWQREPIGTTAWSNLSNGGAYNGATSAALTIAPTTAIMSGDQFQCLVTLAAGTVTSCVPSVLVADKPLIISTFAGQAGTIGDQDGTGTAAQFGYPSGIAVDSAGNVYVADYNNDTIRKITPDGVVTTPYGQAGNVGSADGSGTNALFNTPNAVAIDGSNNLYVADSGNNTIRKIILPLAGSATAGTVTTLAGSATATGSADGTRSAALFSEPEGIAVDRAGSTVYVADTGNATIRKIVASTGAVTTLAGTASSAGWLDGTGAAAAFNEPISVAVNSAGTVFVGDIGNDVIRQITSAGVVTSPYGRLVTTSYADGLGANALFNGPIGLCFDSSDNLYVTDSQNPPTLTSTDTGNNLIRKITPQGVVSTLAGAVGITGSTNGTGPAAEFYNPQAVILDSMGTVYIADTFNQTVRAGVTTLPIVSISATQPNAAVYGPVAGQFTVTRTGSTFPTLTVGTSIGGTAISGTDYTAIPTTLTIAPGSSSAAIAVNPLQDNSAVGNPTVQLTLNNSATYTLGSPSSATVTITEPTSYQTWKLNAFGSNAYVATIGGDTADPNHNGVPNLLEYAFGTNPLATTGANPSPQLSIAQDSTGGQYLAITYTQVGDPNFTYTPQVTSDLTQKTDQWHSGASYTTVVSQSGSGTTQITVRDNTPLSSVSKRYLRLQVNGH